MPDGVRVGGIEDGDEDLLGQVLSGGDAFVRMNDAFHPGAVAVDVAAGIVLDAPVVIVHWCTASGADAGADASFPRSVVRVGRGASAQVVEVVAGPPAAPKSLVVPVTELSAADGSQLSYAALQVLGGDVWHLARLAAVAGRNATLRTFTVGLGGDYDRSRTDALAAGQGSTTELRSAYLGIGSQVHDIRTLQDHAAPHTTSDLLCKGAVAGTSRSVYSGLIRVRRGAVRTNAFQTNHNLVLGEGAHADSVPNLDIEENDVRCSHASTVGPIDEDQRYYLESRGIPPTRAEQLIVLGFFDDIVQRSPVPHVVPRLRREVGLRLAETLALGLKAADDG
jgi:Fe-S cluster assembly protein SufD